VYFREEKIFCIQIFFGRFKEEASRAGVGGVKYGKAIYFG